MLLFLARWLWKRFREGEVVVTVSSVTAKTLQKEIEQLQKKILQLEETITRLEARLADTQDAETDWQQRYIDLLEQRLNVSTSDEDEE